jgi:hypothetical protein
MQFNFGALLVLLVCSFGVVVRGFDWATGNSSVWLSAAAYCETNTYLTRTFKGYSSGFHASYVIDDKAEDVQVETYGLGFVGVSRFTSCYLVTAGLHRVYALRVCHLRRLPRVHLYRGLGEQLGRCSY